MSKSKRIIAILLTLCLMCASLVACGNKESSSQPDAQTSGAAATNDAKAATNAADATAATGAATEAAMETGEDVEWDEDPSEVTWMMWNVGGTFTQDGLKAVENAVNEITLKKINVHVTLEMLEMGSYLSQMPMQVGAGDKIDLISTFPAAAGSFSAMVNSGQLLPLNELLEENAADTLELLPENVLEATTVDGNIYAVPVYTDNTNDLHWLCRASYLEEAGFKAEDIRSIDDVTKVFEAVYKLHPEMKMVSSGGKTLIESPLFTGDVFDSLGTDLLAVMIDKDETKVVSFFETEEYKKAYAILRDWYEKGYIDKDIMIREDDPTSDQTVFSFFVGGNKARTNGSEAMAGEPLVSVKLMEGCVSTTNMTILTTAIPVSATDPEAAARLLNLCYTDKDLKMLVSYGLEGENYSYGDNGGIVVNATGNYAPNTLGIFGNALLCDPTSDQVEIGYDMRQVDQSLINYSPLLGFFVNTDPISNEAAALSGVYTEYQGLVKCGLADEATLQQFIDKLYANGLQAYMDEVQRQLDEWLRQQ